MRHRHRPARLPPARRAQARAAGRPLPRHRPEPGPPPRRAVRELRRSRGRDRGVAARRRHRRLLRAERPLRRHRGRPARHRRHRRDRLQVQPRAWSARAAKPLPRPETVGGSDLAARDEAYIDACLERNPRILPYVSTANVARDFDLVRRGLGEQQINYFGFSYGTFLGTTYETLFPKRTGPLRPRRRARRRPVLERPDPGRSASRPSPSRSPSGASSRPAPATRRPAASAARTRGRPSTTSSTHERQAPARERDGSAPGRRRRPARRRARHALQQGLLGRPGPGAAARGGRGRHRRPDPRRRLLRAPGRRHLRPDRGPLLRDLVARSEVPAAGRRRVPEARRRRLRAVRPLLVQQRLLRPRPGAVAGAAEGRLLRALPGAEVGADHARGGHALRPGDALQGREAARPPARQRPPADDDRRRPHGLPRGLALHRRRDRGLPPGRRRSGRRHDLPPGRALRAPAAPGGRRPRARSAACAARRGT